MSKPHWIANNMCSECWKSIYGYAIQQGYIFCPYCGERLDFEKEPTKQRALTAKEAWGTLDRAIDDIITEK